MQPRQYIQHGPLGSVISVDVHEIQALVLDEFLPPRANLSDDRDLVGELGPVLGLRHGLLENLLEFLVVVVVEGHVPIV